MKQTKNDALFHRSAAGTSFFIRTVNVLLVFNTITFQAVNFLIVSQFTEPEKPLKVALSFMFAILFLY